MRWADTAGWTFCAAHWTVDIDIPIVGSARFESGFTQAVQALLASTELGGSPLQACFYSNKVLRVVSYAQACDRTANRTSRSCASQPRAKQRPETHTSELQPLMRNTY